MTFASGSQLAQSRPSNANTATLFTATLGTEITSLVIANTSNASATYSVYHDNDGTSYDESTALYFGVSLGANTSTVVLPSQGPGTGFTVASGGSIGIKSGTGNALTYTLYGVTEARR